MKYSNIREETLKNMVAQDFFGKFNCAEIIRDIDFAVKLPIDNGACPIVENGNFYRKVNIPDDFGTIELAEKILRNHVF